ncbi:MAG TPA: Fic family protein [Candidatus Saccharimonadales bacterium]|nr:Fic family protein [Candidatus Saccharimonadales bacterium]
MDISINKNSSYVLLQLLQGKDAAVKISQGLPGIDIRTIQRGLNRLTELGVAIKKGTNHPSYSVNYEALLRTNIPAKLLENEERPESTLNLGFINWLRSLGDNALNDIFTPNNLSKMLHCQASMTAKDLEYLTVELSWKSSALEGNTYTLLDTQLLLVEGVKAKNRTEFETQMILNHKNAVTFIIENKELFEDKLVFSTVEELHRIIGYNLGIEKGVRKKLVKITASNYVPLSNPYQLREYADVVLGVISRANDPFARALLALALIPYLQIFEDGNKRTGRMLANALLIQSIGNGFSLRKVSPKQLALAYLSFYEFNSVASLSKILKAELT